MKSILFSISLFILTNTVFSQNQITGQIKDTLGEPLINATLQIKGTNFYTVADGKGNFSLNTPSVYPFIYYCQFCRF